jgi:hypothetical protein
MWVRNCFALYKSGFPSPHLDMPGLGQGLKGYNIDMKKLPAIAIIFFLLFSSAPAQVRNTKELTVVIPAESIAKFIQPLLPYSIDMGENFSGSFWVKSIENIKITKDRVSFSAHIYGKDIGYSAKIGKQIARFKVGDVNLRNHWEASLRYDKNKKTLYIKPHIESPENKKDFSQGDILIDTLFDALSDIEYPIDLNKIKPITAEIYNTELTIDTKISDVYSNNNRLFIEIIPTAQKKDPPE